MERSIYGVFNLTRREYHEVSAVSPEAALSTLQWGAADCVIGRLCHRAVKDQNLKASPGPGGLVVVTNRG